MEAVKWHEGSLSILDQSLLPHRVVYLTCNSYLDVAAAIKRLQVRGAPAIAVAAAYGYALEALNFQGNDPQELGQHLKQVGAALLATRPTAVNLAWALQRMDQTLQRLSGAGVAEIRTGLLQMAESLHQDQRERDEKIASNGLPLIPQGARILTYCNTGGIATAGLGTALGVIIRAHQAGRGVHVYVPETRPVLQGARLTAWELEEAGVPHTLITDNMAGYLFGKGDIDLVILGADRIVANGDFANKIGTYTMAVLASYHHRPFYVAAPLSTFDPALADGSHIPVEMRGPEEVLRIGEQEIAHQGCQVLNPSFDVTPHQLVQAFITEAGVWHPPYDFSRLQEQTAGEGL